MSLDAETFDLVGYYKALWPKKEKKRARAMASSEYRRAITEDDPLAFALIYLRHHLRDDATGGAVTLSDAHLGWIELAREWVTKPTEQKESRDAEIAPRETGKSTWFFLILPLWAAAHGHLKFIAAFADSASQAELHLQSFKTELQGNERLALDYPDLVKAKVGKRGALVSDNRNLYIAKSGFAFAARGIDSGALGMKIGSLRPDLLLLDDVEPGESGYSQEQMKKRLVTITDVILPLASMARVVLVGTVTMVGSIVHQLSKSLGGDEVAEWITTENFRVHHYLPIVTRADGSERSFWPGKWSLEYLQGIRHTRSYKKNFDNDPLGADGDYWSMDDFIVGDLEGITHTLLSIDPAVTTKKSSDFTGLSVLGYSPSTKKVLVKMARAVKLPPAFLRTAILKILVEFPEIGMILVETNQGGDTWKAILHNMPIPIKTVHQDVKKEVRAAEILNDYQRGRVIHVENLAALEGQMTAFPGAPNDDLVDTVGSGVAFFLHPKKRKKVSLSSGSYL